MLYTLNMPERGLGVFSIVLAITGWACTYVDHSFAIMYVLACIIIGIVFGVKAQKRQDFPRAGIVGIILSIAVFFFASV